MPALKWERVNVYDTGRGAMPDDTRQGGDPIMMLMNGLFGTDGFPYQVKQRLGPSANTGISITNTLSAAYGFGGFVLVSAIANDNDSNANAGRFRYSYLPISNNNNWQIHKAPVGAIQAVIPESTPVRGIYKPYQGNNSTNDYISSIYSNPYGYLGNPSTPTSPAVLIANSSSLAAKTALGYPVSNAQVLAVAAGSGVQLTPTTVPTAGVFILYRDATHWFLTRVITNGGGSTTVDPPPEAAFNTTNIDQFPVWGGFDATAGIVSAQDVHATGTAGAYTASACAEFFQGRIVMGNVLFYPKYTAAADKTFAVIKGNRLIWTILNGETPTRGPFTTNSYGLTQLQFPWSIEVNNFIDVDGVGNILQVCNLGDNQLFIIGDQGCARLTGYLSTAVAGVNSSTFDVRPILGSPAGRWPNCAVVTSKGVYFIGNHSIYLYDGNSIQDVLRGTMKQYFFIPEQSFSTNPVISHRPCWAGIIDNDHVYFSGVTANRSAALLGDGAFVLNIVTGKWSMIGLFSGSARQYPQATVVPGTHWTMGSAISGAFQWQSAGFEGTFTQPPYLNVSLNEAGDNSDSPGLDTFNGVPPDYIMALRPVGMRGVPKRFVHLVVNYGLVVVSGSPVVNVRVIYGADYGWPDSAVTAGVLVGTLNPLGGTWTQGGQLPNMSQRFSISETSLFNPRQLGTLTQALPDSMMVMFELVYSGGTCHFKVFSVDVSYIERPGFGHVVMGAA